MHPKWVNSNHPWGSRYCDVAPYGAHLLMTCANRPVWRDLTHILAEEDGDLEVVSLWSTLWVKDLTFPPAHPPHKKKMIHTHRETERERERYIYICTNICRVFVKYITYMFLYHRKNMSICYMSNPLSTKPNQDFWDIFLYNFGFENALAL